MILTKEVKNELEDLVEDFVQSGRWYSNRGLSWQKGILLHGPPGCGKTSTIVGLASKYNMKIYNLSLSNPSISDESLAAAIREVHPRSIVCFEVSISLLPLSTPPKVVVLTLRGVDVIFFGLIPGLRCLGQGSQAQAC